MSELTVLLLAGLAAAVGATVLSLHRRRYGPAAAASAVAVVLVWLLATVAPWLAAAMGAGLAVVGWVRFSRSSATVARWGARSRRKAGVASTTDIARVGSALSMRRKATVVRPSLAQLPARRRLATRTTEVAVPLARVGALGVWSSVEDVVLVFGAPRTGKSVWLIGRIIDAPGAVLVTSTRLDLYEVTRTLRETTRGPVYVFNPAGLGDLASTVRFDPVSGCADPVTATQRAADLVAGGATGADTSGDTVAWREHAEAALATLLHAAALGGLSMRTVAEWVADASAGDGGAHREVTSLLRRSPESSYLTAAEQFFGTNDRTRTSITHSMQPALRWLLSPAATAATETGTPLDVAELLANRGTVYLLGAKEAHTAPLVTALTGHIAREARRLAARQPGGRLDPPLTLALDEAALICPVPLDDWTSDMGGRGVTIIGCFQSRAQLINQWGPTGAAVILNNAGAVMLFGGGTDYDDHEHWSKLAGDRDEPVTTTDASGRTTSRTVRKVPVISPAQLRDLPAWRVVILRRGLRPAIGRIRPTWRRRDVRRDTATRRQTAKQHEHHEHHERDVVTAAEAAIRHGEAATSTGGAQPGAVHPPPGDSAPNGSPAASPGRVPRWVASTRQDRR